MMPISCFSRIAATVALLGTLTFAGKRASAQDVPIYTPANAPATPRLDALSPKESVSQYGITWTFDKPAPVGQFVNGDWYVVGPVTVTAIDPKPLFGDEVKNPTDDEQK